MKTKRLLFLIAIICIIGYASCRKTDQLIEVQTKELFNDFFAVSLSADPSVKKIADKIRLENEKVPFLKDFIENQGVAIWDKVTVMRQAPLPASTNNVSEGIINDTTSFVMIPLVRSGEKHVHGALACKVAGDSVTIHLLDGSEYNWYNQHPDSAGYTGEQLSLMLMQLDETVFGHTLFKIRDSTAFVEHKGDRTRYIKLQPEKSNAIVQRWELKIMTIHYSTFEDLFEGQLHGCEPGDEHCNEYQEVFHSVSYQQYVWVDDDPFPNPWYDPHEPGGGPGETPWVPVEDNSPGDLGGGIYFNYVDPLNMYAAEIECTFGGEFYDETVTTGPGITEATKTHVLKGEVKNGKAGGCHYQGSLGVTARIRPGTNTSPQPPRIDGMFKAKIDIKDVNGNWVQKTEASSFFPNSWSSIDVLTAISQAFANKIYSNQGNIWNGTSSGGIQIRMFLKPNGEIITAFPIF